MQKSIIF